MGCSCWPSPALTTEARTQPATRCGAPAEACRTTIASTPIASIVSTVSRRDSPFESEDVEAVKVMVSADRRFAAVSKESRVRVELSKNSVATVRPRSAGTFGMSRSVTSANESARWSTSKIPSRPRSATESRCLRAEVASRAPDAESSRAVGVEAGATVPGRARAVATAARAASVVPGDVIPGPDRR